MTTIVLGYPYLREKFFDPETGSPRPKFLQWVNETYGVTVDPTLVELMWQEARDGICGFSLWGTPSEEAPVMIGCPVATVPNDADALYVTNFPAFLNNKFLSSAHKITDALRRIEAYNLDENGVAPLCFLLTK